VSWLQIEMCDGVTAFHPGDEIEGTVRWRLDPAPQRLEVRLFWYTRGKGDQDVGVVETLPFDNPGIEERRSFRFRLPAGPYSFSGKLISLLWAIEAVAEPGSASERCEITVSPTGREIVLPSLPAEATTP
jgi:hypothetical protein